MTTEESPAQRTRIEIRQLERGREDPDLLELLGQLRPDLTAERLHELLSLGHDQGLRYLVAHADEIMAGLAGYRTLTTSRGRILFVDDLVVLPTLRSRGIARAIVDELRRRAATNNCTSLELDSSVTNVGAHRFYLRNGLNIRAFHFTGDV